MSVDLVWRLFAPLSPQESIYFFPHRYFANTLIHPQRKAWTSSYKHLHCVLGDKILAGDWPVVQFGVELNCIKKRVNLSYISSAVYVILLFPLLNVCTKLSARPFMTGWPEHLYYLNILNYFVVNVCHCLCQCSTKDHMLQTTFLVLWQ